MAIKTWKWDKFTNWCCSSTRYTGTPLRLLLPSLPSRYQVIPQIHPHTCTTPRADLLFSLPLDTYTTHVTITYGSFVFCITELELHVENNSGQYRTMFECEAEHRVMLGLL